MPPALVMTSCNRSEEPIAITHEHVLEELSDLVDGILTHNRRITNRCDDSVVAALGQRILPMRRSRGYVPEPVVLEEEASPILACGGMLKNAFALTSGRRVFLSQHIGDVSDADNAAHFARAFADFSRLLRLEPEIVVCDMHPDYPTTEFARRLSARRDLSLVQVQHQHAHIVSCLAENGHQGPVIGVAWDGSGYGEDGAVWGGEFLIADRRDYERRYHLEYVPMPGGERAIWNPCRMAAAHLAHAIGPEEAVRRMAPRMNKQECELALQVMDKRDFSPLTSSAGRLFDAVSALLGIRPRVTYEGQAACELEARCIHETRQNYCFSCDGPQIGSPQSAVRIPQSESYAFDYAGEDMLLGEMWRGICEDLDRGLDVGVIATKFHSTMARVIVETCLRLREETDLGTVALSGGVMQNRTLLAAVVRALEGEGFEVLVQTVVPPNDGGLCLGQAACAMAQVNPTDQCV